MITLRIMGGWFATPEADMLIKWVEENPTSAQWNSARGISYINSRIYPATIDFLDEEAALACKLRFGEMLANG